MEGEVTPVQQKVNSLLRTGIVFSIVWLAGVGSIIALVCGLKAKRLIVQSGGRVVGMGRVRWCFIAGSLGVAIWLPIILVAVANNLGR